MSLTVNLVDTEDGMGVSCLLEILEPWAHQRFNKECPVSCSGFQSVSFESSFWSLFPLDLLCTLTDCHVQSALACSHATGSEWSTALSNLTKDLPSLGKINVSSHQLLQCCLRLYCPLHSLYTHSKCIWLFLFLWSVTGICGWGSWMLNLLAPVSLGCRKH